MKKIIFTIFLLMLFFQPMMFGQGTAELSYRNDECPNRNLSFMNIDENNPLHEYIFEVESKGIIEFRPFTIDDIGGWDKFFDAISGDPHTTFEYKGMTESNLFDGYYHRFIQLYQGIPVKGGGFSLFMNLDDPEAFRRPNFPIDPCKDKFLRMSLNIYENIDIGVSPVITANNVVNQLPDEVTDVNDLELKLVNNSAGDCAYQLIWQAKYNGDHGGAVGWVDAHAGEFIYETHLNHYHNKPGPSGGFPLLNDTNDEDLDVLSNAEYGLSVYDMSGVQTYEGDPPLGGTFPVEMVDHLNVSFSNDQIPTSPHSQAFWSLEDGTFNTFLAFELGINILVNLRDNFDVTLENVNIGVHPTAEGYGIYYSSPLGEDREGHWIGLGVDDDGNSAVRLSSIGHELGHAILLDASLNDFSFEALSVHEGISDMFGMYFANGTTWVQAERDYTFTNLQSNCFTNSAITNTTSQHFRGRVLGHWFYFCVNGDASNSIPPMDITEVMQLVYEALPNLSDSPDFPDLMEATVDLARIKYGKCSDQFATIVRAWDKVCIPTGEAIVDPEANCIDLEVISPHQPQSHVCEENDDGGLYFTVRLTGYSGLDINAGRWYIEGRHASLFESVHGMTGNHQNGGINLRIDHVPDMGYYPQNFRISYRHPQLPRHISTIVKILDCDGDDPTCEDIYEPPANEKSEKETDTLPENYKLIIYDILGNKIGTDKFEHGNIPPGILIYSYWEENGKFIKSEKVIMY